MAHSRSAKKRVRQNEKRRLRNRMAKGTMRTSIKRLRKLVEGNQLDEAVSYYPKVVHEIDTTAKKGTIHVRTASRYKSRLAKLIRKQQTASS